jgi:hypothetical protein
MRRLPRLVVLAIVPLVAGIFGLSLMAVAAPSVSAVESLSPGALLAASTPTVVTGTGSVGVSAAITAFRNLLGGPLNGVTPGQQPAGRREINWDAAPITHTNTSTFPPAFFNTNSKRGAVFSTPGSGFRVSDNNFSDVNASYAGQFGFFSPLKTFAAIGSNVMEVRFQVAGSTTPAMVSGFGVVFVDVDEIGTAFVEYFAGAHSLGAFVAPLHSGDSPLSFVGVHFGSPTVTRVRITSGHAALGGAVADITDDPWEGHDLVVMDDFLYGEPNAIKPVFLPTIVR